MFLDGLDPRVPDWENTGGNNAPNHDTEQQYRANAQDRRLSHNIFTEDIFGNLQVIPDDIAVTRHQQPTDLIRNQII